LQKYVEQVVTDTAANKSSMLQDVLAQRRTEIAYLSGYVVRRGRALGVECPANEELWKQVRSLTASYTHTTD
jgi:2-dehydropantoate 2-reductase